MLLSLVVDPAFRGDLASAETTSSGSNTIAV